LYDNEIPLRCASLRKARKFKTQLAAALAQRNKENVAADISAHHFHDLRVRDVLGAADFDLVAGIDA